MWSAIQSEYERGSDEKYSPDTTSTLPFTWPSLCAARDTGNPPYALGSKKALRHYYTTRPPWRFATSDRTVNHGSFISSPEPRSDYEWNSPRLSTRRNFTRSENSCSLLSDTLLTPLASRVSCMLESDEEQADGTGPHETSCYTSAKTTWSDGDDPLSGEKVQADSFPVEETISTACSSVTNGIPSVSEPINFDNVHPTHNVGSHMRRIFEHTDISKYSVHEDLCALSIHGQTATGSVHEDIPWIPECSPRRTSVLDEKNDLARNGPPSTDLTTLKMDKFPSTASPHTGTMTNSAGDTDLVHHGATSFTNPARQSEWPLCPSMGEEGSGENSVCNKSHISRATSTERTALTVVTDASPTQLTPRSTRDYHQQGDATNRRRSLSCGLLDLSVHIARPIDIKRDDPLRPSSSQRVAFTSIAPYLFEGTEHRPELPKLKPEACSTAPEHGLLAGNICTSQRNTDPCGSQERPSPLTHSRLTVSCHSETKVTFLRPSMSAPICQATSAALHKACPNSALFKGNVAAMRLTDPSGVNSSNVFANSYSDLGPNYDKRLTSLSCSLLETTIGYDNGKLSPSVKPDPESSFYMESKTKDSSILAPPSLETQVFADSVDLLRSEANERDPGNTVNSLYAAQEPKDDEFALHSANPVLASRPPPFKTAQLPRSHVSPRGLRNVTRVCDRQINDAPMIPASETTNHRSSTVVCEGFNARSTYSPHIFSVSKYAPFPSRNSGSTYGPERRQQLHMSNAAPTDRLQYMLFKHRLKLARAKQAYILRRRVVRQLESLLQQASSLKVKSIPDDWDTETSSLLTEVTSKENEVGYPEVEDGAARIGGQHRKDGGSRFHLAGAAEKAPAKDGQSLNNRDTVSSVAKESSECLTSGDRRFRQRSKPIRDSEDSMSSAQSADHIDSELPQQSLRQRLSELRSRAEQQLAEMLTILKRSRSLPRNLRPVQRVVTRDNRNDPLSSPPFASMGKLLDSEIADPLHFLPSHARSSAGGLTWFHPFTPIHCLEEDDELFHKDHISQQDQISHSPSLGMPADGTGSAGRGDCTITDRTQLAVSKPENILEPARAYQVEDAPGHWYCHGALKTVPFSSNKSFTPFTHSNLNTGADSSLHSHSPRLANDTCRPPGSFIQYIGESISSKNPCIAKRRCVRPLLPRDEQRLARERKLSQLRTNRLRMKIYGEKVLQTVLKRSGAWSLSFKDI
ncbi:unnamed protein product [Dicrocoelium dendriticum]|nr:unnamed protein product [Dicrocoelium dendriticum]